MEALVPAGGIRIVCGPSWRKPGSRDVIQAEDVLPGIP